jgi:hypothetical protein
VAVVVTRRALIVDHDSTAFDALRQAFARDHVVPLPGFFPQEMLTDLWKRFERAEFSRRVEHGVEIEHTLEESAPLALVLVPLNDPALFTVIDRITNCGAIGCFSGRVQLRRASANGGHYYPWHSDASHDRLVGLSVNLSQQAFEGGLLEIRRAESQRVIAHVANSTPGDAVLFRISPDFEHHVTPVTTEAPRVVLAGWFRRTPEFWASRR